MQEQKLAPSNIKIGKSGGKDLSRDDKIDRRERKSMVALIMSTSLG